MTEVLAAAGGPLVARSRRAAELVEQVAEAARQHAAYIKTEVLAVDLTIEEQPPREGMTEITLGDATAKVEIQKT